MGSDEAILFPIFLENFIVNLMLNHPSHHDLSAVISWNFIKMVWFSRIKSIRAL